MQFSAHRLLTTSLVGMVCANAISAQGVQRRPFGDFTPGACAVTPILVDFLATRDLPDNTVWVPAKDTTSRLASDSAMVCSAPFGGSTSENWQLLNLARVELIVGADSAARSLGQRYLRSAAISTPAKRAWALYLIISDHAAARPARFAAARESLAELDRLGAPAGKARVLAHFALAEAAQRHFDERRVVSEANAVISVWKTLPLNVALETAFPMARSFVMKAEIALRVTGPLAAQAIIDTADKLVPPQAGAERGMISTYKELYKIVGKTGAPIEAEYWIGVNDSTADTEPRPIRGRVTLLSEARHSCGRDCNDRYQGLRRLGERFGSRVDIITFTQTLGFHSDTAPIAPLDEARYDSAYFLGKQRLPGTLAVYVTTFDWIPDGRRWNRPTPQGKNYPGASMIVFDRKGVVRYANARWEPVLEDPVARFIEKLILEPD